MRYSPCPETSDTFDWSWNIIVRALPFLADRVVTEDGRNPMLSPSLVRIIRSELTLLEALMRRLLILLAMTMNLPARRRRAGPIVSAPRLPREAADTPKASSAKFRLLEPQPSARRTPPLQQNKGPMPRIRVIDLDAPPSKARVQTPAPDPFVPIDGTALARRIEALQDVLLRPGVHVARMAQQIARLRADVGAKHAPKRQSIITPHRVPGSSRKRHGHGYFDFYALHRAAIDAFNSRLDSS